MQWARGSGENDLDLGSLPGEDATSEKLQDVSKPYFNCERRLEI